MSDGIAMVKVSLGLPGMDVLEVIEGSVVASGSQGTRFVAGTRALRLDDALAAARRDFHTPIELGAGGLWEDE